MTKVRMLPSIKEVVFSPYQLAASKRIEGDPTLGLHEVYQSADAKFSVGFWEGDEGIWQVDYTEEEYCYMLEGISQITDTATQQTFTVRAGDQFVIPAGLKGTWQVIEKTRKVYVIYEKTAEA